MNGIINLDKPPGISSARAVTKVKHLLPRGTKIGHAGTLDPFATGVLLLLIGRGTKLCENLMDEPKQYETTLKLGATTATDDPASPERVTPDAHPVELDRIRHQLQGFVGLVPQRPPDYSALKIHGQRSYDLARKGLLTPAAPRQVRIDSIEILAYEWPLLKLRIDCGRGTYIRAIARDLGESLGVGAYLTELRRTKVGPYTAADAVTLDIVAHEGPEKHLRAI